MNPYSQQQSPNPFSQSNPFGPSQQQSPNPFGPSQQVPTSGWGNMGGPHSGRQGPSTLSFPRSGPSPSQQGRGSGPSNNSPFGGMDMGMGSSPFGSMMGGMGSNRGPSKSNFFDQGMGSMSGLPGMGGMSMPGMSQGSGMMGGMGSLFGY